MMRAPRAIALAASVGGAVLLAGCDLLMTEPRPATEVEIAFQIASVPLGGTSAAFSRVRRVRLTFTPPDGMSRDTTIAVVPFQNRIRAPVALTTRERVQALGIVAELGFAQTALFDGATVVPIVPGQPTTAEITIAPVPASVRPDRPLLTLTGVGTTDQLLSAVLFATGDTITGLSGAWTSLDPTVVSITPTGLALAQRIGVTQLEVRFGPLADTIPARVN